MGLNIPPEMKKVKSPGSWAGVGGLGKIIYAYQPTGNELYSSKCQLVMKRCLKDPMSWIESDFTLCSGYNVDYCLLIPIFRSIERDYSGFYSYRLPVRLKKSAMPAKL